jgi:hypothetical protein
MHYGVLKIRSFLVKMPDEEKEREELAWESWRDEQFVDSDHCKWRSLLGGLMRPVGHGEDNKQ